MFGKVIYYDYEKIMEYTSFITGKPFQEANLVKKAKSRGASVGVKAIGVEATNEEVHQITSKEGLLNNIIDFEKKLESRDDYFDFISNNFHLESIPRAHIIKFNSFVYVPEKFDMIQTIEQFRPLLISHSISEMEDDEADAFQSLLDVEATRVPIECNLNDTEICALIERGNLEIPYEELEEYEMVEMFILARTLDSKLAKKEKPYFEPFKHFIKLNRTMRRQMKHDGTNELSPIYASEDYRLVEIIAIYG